MATGTILVYNPLTALMCDAEPFSSIVTSGKLQTLLDAIPSGIWANAESEEQEKIKQKIKLINLLYCSYRATSSLASKILSASYGSNDLTDEMCVSQFENFRKGLKARIIPNICTYGSTPFPMRLKQLDGTQSSLPAPAYNQGGTIQNPFYYDLMNSGLTVWPVLSGINHNTEKEQYGWNVNTSGDYADFMIGSSVCVNSYTLNLGCFAYTTMRNQYGSTAYSDFSYAGSDVEASMKYFYDSLLPSYFKPYILPARKYFGSPSNSIYSDEYSCWLLSAKELGQTAHGTNGYMVPTQEWNNTEKYQCYPAVNSSNSNNSMRVYSFSGYNGWQYMWTRTPRPYATYKSNNSTIFLVVGDSSGSWHNPRLEQ